MTSNVQYSLDSLEYSSLQYFPVWVRFAGDFQWTAIFKSFQWFLGDLDPDFDMDSLKRLLFETLLEFLQRNTWDNYPSEIGTSSQVSGFLQTWSFTLRISGPVYSILYTDQRKRNSPIALCHRTCMFNSWHYMGWIISCVGSATNILVYYCFVSLYFSILPFLVSSLCFHYSFYSLFIFFPPFLYYSIEFYVPLF